MKRVAGNETVFAGWANVRNICVMIRAGVSRRTRVTLPGLEPKYRTVTATNFGRQQFWAESVTHLRAPILILAYSIKSRPPSAKGLNYRLLAYLATKVKRLEAKDAACFMKFIVFFNGFGGTKSKAYYRQRQIINNYWCDGRVVWCVGHSKAWLW